MRLRVAFTALLLVAFAAATVLVKPDVNVTCDGAFVMLSWNYSGIRNTNTTFRLNFMASGAPGPTFEAETAEQRYNLSDVAWRHYLDFLHVDVTARQGGAASLPAKSKTFTFNQDKMAQVKCAFHFPPVLLVRKESGAEVSFQNPSVFYKLKPVSKNMFFKFRVSNVSTSPNSSDQGGLDAECRDADGLCRRHLPLHGDACVTLTGAMHDGLESAVFRATAPVCLTESTDVYVGIFTGMMLLLLLVVAAVVACVCGSKAWTLEKWLEKLPAVLDVDHAELQYHTANREQYSSLAVGDAERRCDLSQEEEGDEDAPPPPPPSPPPMDCYLYEGGLSGASDEEGEALPLHLPNSAYDRQHRCA